MEELKTLKDLHIFRVKAMQIDKVVIDISDLKKEAINHVKHFKSGEAWTDFAADERKGQENLIEWIEYFFDIKEEDLE